MAELALWCSKDTAIRKIRQLHRRSDLLVDAFDEATRNSREFKAWKWPEGANVYGAFIPEHTLGLCANRQSVSLLFFSQPLQYVIGLLIAGDHQSLKQDAFISQSRKKGYSFELNADLSTRLAMEYTTILGEISHRAYNRTLGVGPLPDKLQSMIDSIGLPSLD